MSLSGVDSRIGVHLEKRGVGTFIFWGLCDFRHLCSYPLDRHWRVAGVPGMTVTTEAEDGGKLGPEMLNVPKHVGAQVPAGWDLGYGYDGRAYNYGDRDRLHLGRAESPRYGR